MLDRIKSVYNILKGNKLLSVHLHLFGSSQTFTPPLHMHRGSHIVSIQAQQPCYPWISSSPITRLTRECDLISPLLPLHFFNLFSSSPYLISFFSRLPSLSTTHICLILPLSFSHLLSCWLFFFTAASHTSLVAAARLLKLQNWLMLLPWW